jgi:hypothetical protein
MGKRPAANSTDDRIEWQEIEDNMSIGRFVNQPNYVVLA